MIKNKLRVNGQSWVGDGHMGNGYLGGHFVMSTESYM